MSLNYAILGYLGYHPASGYALKKMFDHSVRHFWRANQSQIYRSLADLHRKGWVDMSVEEQDERPDRKVYTITPAGRDALRVWLTETLPPPSTRSAPLIQAFFAGQLSNAEILQKFEQYRQQMLTLFQMYDRIPEYLAEMKAEVDSEREAYFWHATLNLGKRTLAANIDWCDAVIADLRNGIVPE